MSAAYLSAIRGNLPCSALNVDESGLASACDNTPVWELKHSRGQSVSLCEWHIEFYWNYIPAFRSAVRDVWPLKMGSQSK
jgi:hypothetical protein